MKNTNARMQLTLLGFLAQIYIDLLNLALKFFKYINLPLASTTCGCSMPPSVPKTRTVDPQCSNPHIRTLSWDNIHHRD